MEAAIYVYKLIKGQKKQYAIFFFGMLFIRFTEIISPVLFGIMINQIVYYQNVSLFIKISITFFILSVFSCILFYLVYELYLYIGNTINYKMRTRLFEHLQILTVEELSEVEYGDSINLVQHYCEDCMDFAVRDNVHNFNNIVQIILCLILIFQMKLPIGWVLLLLVPISVLFTKMKSIQVQKCNLENKKDYGHFIGWIYEVINSISNIRILAAEDLVRETFYEKQNKVLDSAYKAESIKIQTEQSTSLFNLSIQMILYGTLTFISVRYSLSIGIIIIVLSYFTKMKKNLELFISNYIDMQKRLVTISKIRTFLSRKTEREVWKGKSELVVKNPEIRFEHVFFQYNHSTDVLRDINIRVNPGEKLALVGASGSGKTTLAYLLMGYHTPQRGHIYIDQMELEKCTLESIRKQVGLIQQDVMILNASVKDNLTMNQKNISEKRLKEACTAADIQEFVEELPQKLETIIGEKERNLSGGQKQRISIARNYIKCSKILIFDEATSALDSKTEKLIFDSWEKVLKEKTSIMIAHRLSTVMLCDRVAVMENGEIVEAGTPEELYRSGRAFQKIFSISERYNGNF